MPYNILTKMGKKQAQTRMIETAAVVIVFLMLLAFGFVFYANILRGNLNEKLADAKETRALKIAKTALNMPELQCSKTQPIQNCFDKLKIQGFQAIIQRDSNDANTYYYDLLKDSKITIRQIYPIQVSQYSQTIYEMGTEQSKQSIWMPIAIYDPLKDTASFGILTVDVYEQA
ncbi:hypothetical protein HYY72_00125 [Candidatus Woesearchaeota archaeon]|nr:hypothetical protein [Candidatus Woesearchaeota archaeon]